MFVTGLASYMTRAGLPELRLAAFLLAVILPVSAPQLSGAAPGGKTEVLPLERLRLRQWSSRQLERNRN